MILHKLSQKRGSKPTNENKDKNQRKQESSQYNKHVFDGIYFIYKKIMFEN